LKFINPEYRIPDDDNIFLLRKKEYDNLLENIKKIVEPVKKMLKKLDSK
jgi:hypothetical protein